MEQSKVLVVMGSRSDLPVMEGCLAQLKELEIPFKVRVLSAHRTPEAVIMLSQQAKEDGIQVIIAAAGGAAHLAGVLASSTTLPIIGIPMQTSALGGMDSLLSTVQMPAGVPVATVAIGKAGAKNAAILAGQILALSDPKIEKAIDRFKQSQKEKVLEGSILEEYE